MQAYLVSGYVISFLLTFSSFLSGCSAHEIARRSDEDQEEEEDEEEGFRAQQQHGLRLFYERHYPKPRKGERCVDTHHSPGSEMATHGSTDTL